MKRILFSILMLSVVFQCAFAQNCNGRYETEIASGFTVTTVQYTDVYTVRPNNGDTLKMDVYQPDGDTFAKRPVIIMAHGGTFIAGDRTESTCAELCELFAKRGYVAASIDYRLAGSQAELLDSLDALAIALKAVGDMKSSVRYFRKDAATANQFHIDPNQIWVGGNSAGAIAALHVAFVTDTAELPVYIKTIVAQNGGIDGNSGNDGYSSAVSGVINLAGGINKVQWINAGDVPIVSCHGDNDDTVPFDCDDVLYEFLDLVNLCGSGAINSWCQQVGTEDTLLVFPGDGHVPWQSTTAKFNQMSAFVLDFVAKHTTCDSSAVGIRQSAAPFFSVYPNPATELLTIQLPVVSEKENIKVVVYDATGKVVLRQQFSGSQEIQLSIEKLQAGFYVLRVTNDKKTAATAIEKL